MDGDDFEDWVVCRQANELFYERMTERQKCITCSTLTETLHDRYISTLWKSTGCWGGHNPLDTRTPNGASTREGPTRLGICDACDVYFPLNVAKGILRCTSDGCRRALRLTQREGGRLRYFTRADMPSNDFSDYCKVIKRREKYQCCILMCEKEYGPSIEDRSGPTPECNHDRNACNECLGAVLESAISTANTAGLVCPDRECGKTIPGDALRKLVSPGAYRRYCKIQSYELLSKKPGFRWCVCGEGQIHSAGESAPIWTCHSCSIRHCFICRDNSTGTCEHLRVADHKRRDDRPHLKKAAVTVLLAKKRSIIDGTEKTEELKRRTTKKCPKKDCGNVIEHDGGCAHMQCKKPRGCGTHFCWLCKVIWATEGRETKHLKSCAIGSERNKVDRDALDCSDYAEGWDKDPGYDRSLDQKRSMLRYQFD